MSKGKGQNRDNNLAEKYQNTGLCTTCMIRHVPREYLQDELIEEVSSVMGSSDLFDFFYLPADTQNGGNTGYAFVNFLDAPTAQRAVKTFSNYHFQKHPSKTAAKVLPAHIQGLENNLRHLEDRAVVHGNHPCCPVVMWKGRKVEISKIFEEFSAQEALRKFAAPMSVPPRLPQDPYSGFGPDRRGMQAHGSLRGGQQYGMGPPDVTESFSSLLDRVAGVQPWGHSEPYQQQFPQQRVQDQFQPFQQQPLPQMPQQRPMRQPPSEHQHMLQPPRSEGSWQQGGKPGGGYANDGYSGCGFSSSQMSMGRMPMGGDGCGGGGGGGGGGDLFEEEDSLYRNPPMKWSGQDYFGSRSSTIESSDRSMRAAAPMSAPPAQYAGMGNWQGHSSTAGPMARQAHPRSNLAPIIDRRGDEMPGGSTPLMSQLSAYGSGTLLPGPPGLQHPAMQDMGPEIDVPHVPPRSCPPQSCPPAPGIAPEPDGVVEINVMSAHEDALQSFFSKFTS